MPDRTVVGRTLSDLLGQFASTFWASVFLTFSVNASIASLWSVFVPGDTRIEHRLVLLVIIAAVTIVGAFAELARRALAEADEQRRSAEVRRIPMPVARSGHIYEGRLFLFVDQASALANDTAVAIYQNVNGFEFEIGVGRVNRTEHTDGAQIEIVDQRDKGGLWVRIGANEPGLLSTLTIRSALPFDVYRRMVAP